MGAPPPCLERQMTFVFFAPLLTLPCPGRVTEALSEECVAALQDHFPASEGKQSKDQKKKFYFRNPSSRFCMS